MHLFAKKSVLNVMTRGSDKESPRRGRVYT